MEKKGRKKKRNISKSSGMKENYERNIREITLKTKPLKDANINV
jgi:hypothetical protein